VGALAAQVVRGTPIVEAIRLAQAGAALNVACQQEKLKDLSSQSVIRFLLIKIVCKTWQLYHQKLLHGQLWTSF